MLKKSILLSAIIVSCMLTAPLAIAGGAAESANASQQPKVVKKSDDLEAVPTRTAAWLFAFALIGFAVNSARARV